jgi:hypothetical protein
MIKNKKKLSKYSIYLNRAPSIDFFWLRLCPEAYSANVITDVQLKFLFKTPFCEHNLGGAERLDFLAH